MTGPRILTLDIETSPALVWTFDLRNVNIGIHQIAEPTRMISFAAKWRGDKRVIFFSEWADGTETMVRAAHALLDQADVVVTYNGDNFDIPHINREIELLNVELNREGDFPPLLDYSPFVSVDLYKVCKKHQRWMSHKLAYITEQLELSGKLRHEGFELWLKVLAGDPKARRDMTRYNKRDVVTTEELFDHMRSKITNLPQSTLYDDCVPDPDRPVCPPPCGSTNVQRRGFARTKTRRYPRFQCQECGRWLRGTRSDKGANLT